MLFLLFNFHYNGHDHRSALCLLVYVLGNLVLYFELHLVPVVAAVEANFNRIARYRLDIVDKRFRFLGVYEAAGNDIGPLMTVRVSVSTVATTTIRPSWAR